MADGSPTPQLFTIPATRAFADALAAGLIRRFGGDPLGLARGMVLLPNNRAKRAVTDAFVRASGGGLLLPRLVAIGDPALGEGMAALLDPAGDAPLAPAVAPLQRRMILARLVAEARARDGAPVDAGEAVRLAGELARTLDQLLVEEVLPERLGSIAMAPELSEHWRTSLALFAVVLERWPAELARIGCIDAATRRAALLDRLAARWRRAAPAGFVCAAGITDAAPAVTRLLRCVSELPDGMVVLAGLGTDLADAEWDALGPHDPDPETGFVRRSIETHPQFHLKRLLNGMGVARGEFAAWPDVGLHDAGDARGRAIANALAPADFTGKWTRLDEADRRLDGVAAAELATPGQEAQAIALALREVLETPERTAALVTPDRALARRVAAHCRRWGVAIDDSAGRPLAILPPGTLLLALVEAAAQDFAPLALLTLVKHPLVHAGEGRLAWLDGARALDRALRGPRPAAGLAGIDALLADLTGRETAVRRAAAAWWPEARELLAPLGRAFATASSVRAEPVEALSSLSPTEKKDSPSTGSGQTDSWVASSGQTDLSRLLATLRETAQALAGDAAWTGPAGRAAAELLAELEERADDGPPLADPTTLGPLLRTLMDEVAVRPPPGGDTRMAIYGLIEARLQTADLVILGGLNEGVWPGGTAPDPWLAPRVRAELGLPGLETRIGIAAHDFAQALGAPAVLLTRARRDAKSPALASRFWLRLEAMAGDGLARADALVEWVRALDDPGVHAPAVRPAPLPPKALRPTTIAVTEVDRLKADPYAFYARQMLGLFPLDMVDADPSAAWRGTAVHAVLEAWAREDDCAPDTLHARAMAMMADARTHPLLRALWWPRLEQGIAWVAQQIAADRADGREVLRVEGGGRAVLDGITLTGRFDRIDRLPGGGIGIVDYKTGKPPSAAAVRDGFSLQLGLLGVVAELGGFEGAAGTAGAFEYWSLAKKGSQFGYRESPCDTDGKRDKIVTADFTAIAADNFAGVAAKWLTGEEPFTAKLHPEYAPYADYDQLMRRDEWYGRD